MNRFNNQLKDMKIDKLRIKVLAVVFALLATAGLGECFAQTPSWVELVRKDFIVREGIKSVQYEVYLAWPKNSPAALQRSLSQMMFGIDNDTLMVAYNEWLGSLGKLRKVGKRGNKVAVVYRRHLMPVSYAPGRYVSFSSVADADCRQFRMDVEPEQVFGYKYYWAGLMGIGGTGISKLYNVVRVTTNEKGMIYDYRQGRQLAVGDVLTPQGLKDLGVDRLGDDVSMLLTKGEIVFANATSCFSYKVADIEDCLTDSFLVLIGRKLDAQAIARQYFKDLKSPELAGGDGFYDYIRKNIHVPDSTLRGLDIESRLVVEFTVNEDGSLSDVNVEKSLHPLIDAEVLRVIGEMPKWKPATLRGKPTKYHCGHSMGLLDFFDDIYDYARFLRNLE